MNELEKIWEKIISNFSVENAFRIGSAVLGFIIAFVLYKIIRKYVNSITTKNSANRRRLYQIKLYDTRFILLWFYLY